jgi:hypothetical protein
MLRGASVRCDDEIAIAAPVVGERRRPRPAVTRAVRREQEKAHPGELTAHDAAVRAELLDHSFVEAVRVAHRAIR